MTKKTGHNSKETGDKIRNIIEAVEADIESIKSIKERTNEVLDNAKSAGFDIKTIRKIIKMRATPKDQLEAEQLLLKTYCDAVQLDLFNN